MNVATISTINSEWRVQLQRWVYMMEANMPDADRYLLVPLERNANMKIVNMFVKAATPYFKDIKAVTLPDIGGRLMAFDMLRASLPSIFGLDELLYMDPDTDVRSPLYDLPDIHPEAELMLTPAPIETQTVRQVIVNAIQQPYHAQLCDIGFMYMRRDFTDDFSNLLKEGRVDMASFCPGMAIWNIIAMNCPSAVLPAEYHQSWWAMEKLVNVRVIHFSGQSKKIRPFLRYDDAGEGSISLVRDPYDISGIEF